MAPEDLPDTGLDALLLHAGPLEEFVTTGTRGVPRSVFWPAGTVADVGSLVAKVSGAARLTATYTSAVVDTDVFLKAHLDGLRRNVPGVAIASFATSSDVASMVRNSDAVILTDYPSALARFVRLANAAIEERILPPDGVTGTRLVARLTGEPMDPRDLIAWHQGATGVGFETWIELRYGCTELLGIGRSEFRPEHPEVEYELSHQSCFVEVLDTHSLTPVHEGRGVLCATSYRTSGTILYRYLLGDEVEVFERAGRRFVRDITRADALMVTGNTVSLSDLIARCRHATGLEVCVDVRKAVDRLTGVQHVDVTAYVPATERTVIEAVRRSVELLLLDGLKIRPAVSSELVTLTVRGQSFDTSAVRRRKSWRLSNG